MVLQPLAGRLCGLKNHPARGWDVDGTGAVGSGLTCTHPRNRHCSLCSVQSKTQRHHRNERNIRHLEEQLAMLLALIINLFIDLQYQEEVSGSET